MFHNIGPWQLIIVFVLVYIGIIAIKTFKCIVGKDSDDKKKK